MGEMTETRIRWEHVEAEWMATSPLHPTAIHLKLCARLSRRRLDADRRTSRRSPCPATIWTNRRPGRLTLDEFFTRSARLPGRA